MGLLRKLCKKSAFTLMEISLVILVLSILIMLCIPMIKKQMQKSDEYSYYLAYRTVEKLGSQIVAYGDPYEITAMNNYENTSVIAENKTNETVKQCFLSDKFNMFLNKFVPQVQAKQIELTSWSEYEYQIARLCLKHLESADNDTASPSNTPVLLHSYGDSDEYLTYETLLGNWKYITGNSSSPTVYDPCYIFFNSKTNANYNPDLELIKKRFTGSSSYSGDIIADMWSKSPSNFCANLETSKIKPEYLAVNETYTTGGNNEVVPYNICVLKTKDLGLTTETFTRQSFTPPSLVDNCDNLGYVNTINVNGNCMCQSGYILSYNNNRVCCPAPTTGKTVYSYKKDDSYECISLSCSPNRYNEFTHSCCPEHSSYSPTSGVCICDDGYKMNSMGTCVETNDCQAGTHANSAGICVANAPIVKANRFCELIADSWNIKSKNCATFEDESGISYNKTLFQNLVTSDGHYLSINTSEKTGVFKTLPPNIVFLNGLKLWILGDKAASIAGLSFNPTGYKADLNICKNKNINTESACSALTGNSKYFCKPENQCFDIKTEFNNNHSFALADARNCCSTVDISDYIDKYKAKGYLKDARTYAINGFTIFVDIDGDKGEGTLWEDVYPFYVSSNGKVYPGYPLDAPKNSPSKYIGGNSSSLSADVYYYDLDSDESKARRKIVAFASVPYAKALCFARDVSAYTPYCLNLGTAVKGYNDSYSMDKYINSTGQTPGIPENPCYTHRCFVHVKNKMKFL